MTLALDLQDVRAGYGRIEVLHGLDQQVPEGSVVALLGPNGVGKTTTLRAISGTIPVSSGSVRYRGRRIDGLQPNAIASRGLVLVPEGRGVFPALSVEENLRIAHRGGHGGGATWEEWLDHAVTAFPRLGERLTQSAGSLSGGEQQMLAVCRSLAGDPKVVMFDELSMGLAPLVVQSLFERVAALREGGRSILLVEQYLTYALELADVCYVLAKGKVAWAGEPAELKTSATAASYLAG